MPPEWVNSAYLILSRIQNHVPQHIRHLICEYYFLTSWCLLYPRNFMEEVFSSIKSLKRIYAENPTNRLQRHATSLIKQVNIGYKRAALNVRRTNGMMGHISRYFINNPEHAVPNQLLTHFLHTALRINFILRNIKRGLRILRKIRQEEILCEQQYYMMNRLCYRCGCYRQPQIKRHLKTRRQNSTVVLQDENLSQN